MPRFVIVIIGLVVAWSLFHGVGPGGGSIEEAISNGRPPMAPSSDLPVLGGTGSASVAAWRGRVVVLNFWASWCGPCNEEAPVLNRAQQRVSAAGGTVLGVTYNDAPQDSLNFMRVNAIGFPSVRDEAGVLAASYDVSSVPATFVIDASGHIVDVARGSIDDGFVDRALQAALPH